MPQFVKVIHYPPLIRTATQYSYDENNRLTRWVYTIPTLSRTAMHYAYNTNTEDTVPDGALTGVTMFDGGSIAYSYDFLQRLSNRTIAGKLKETYAYAPGSGENTTTNRVSTKRVFWNNALIHQFQHGYDALGNITSVFDAHTGKRVNYTYDDQGQLLQANHIENGTTVTRIEQYSYDSVGNIKRFDNGTTIHEYVYGDEQWKDLLKEVDDQPITYDDSGNPISYYNGYTMTWVEGRRLDSVTTSNGTYTYVYNSDGQRVKKTNPDGSYIEYYVVNGVTVGESHYASPTNKTKSIRYTLDENNSVIGFTTGGVNYYFAKNLQGDVLEVYNASTNEVVAQYTYDSWGNILTATGSMAETNPFRYRGYYYDVETGFYYLQSRYYDAAIGRFINADVFTSSGRGILGNNMFAYCNNNPVMYTDGSGFACVPSTTATSGGGKLHDYIIYYYNEESSQNLDGPAKRNHSDPGDIFASAGSFEELVAALNNCPNYIDDIYIYMHGNENSLSFYQSQYYSADDIAKYFSNVNIEGYIYLFSCRGGMGDLASTIANKTNCTVIACTTKVSFDNGSARCSWEYYFKDQYGSKYGPISWYSFYPDGRNIPYRFWYIYTQ